MSKPQNLQDILCHANIQDLSEHKPSDELNKIHSQSDRSSSDIYTLKDKPWYH